MTEFEIKLPRVEKMLEGPGAGLTEVRTSLNETLAGFEKTLLFPRLPKIRPLTRPRDVLLEIEEFLPARVPRLSEILEEKVGGIVEKPTEIKQEGVRVKYE